MTKHELWEKAKMLPLLPGVYIIRDKTGQIIYIGKAKRLRTRVSQYFREGVPHDAKVTKMIQNAFEFDVIVTQSEFEALVLECSQIKQHKPKYNILLKDDKGYSYVRVTREAYPRVSAVLQKEEDGAEYIGPYTSSFAVREMVETACNVFRLPRCGKKIPAGYRQRPPLPERAYRPVHGPVQRQNIAGELLRNRTERGASHPARAGRDPAAAARAHGRCRRTARFPSGGAAARSDQRHRKGEPRAEGGAQRNRRAGCDRVCGHGVGCMRGHFAFSRGAACG